MRNRRRALLRMALGAGCALWLTMFSCGMAEAQEPKADNVPAKPMSALVQSEEPASTAASDYDMLNDVPINVAFYKPSVYYPPLSLRRILPRAQHTAWGWALCAVVLFGVMTWPVNAVELVFWEREERQRQRQKRSVVRATANEAETENSVQLVTRQVVPVTDNGEVAGWEADSVPLLGHVRSINGAQAAGTLPNEETVSALPPRTNPLQYLRWNNVQAQFRLPLMDGTVGAGLHIINCAQALEDTLNDAIVDLLRTTSGSIVIVSANFNETKLINDIVGAQDKQTAERLALIRRHAAELNGFLQRLAFTPGRRLFSEDFLRLVTELGRKRGGIAAVFMDMTARAEIGAYPRQLSAARWCETLHGIATHGAFPIFLLVEPNEGMAELPYQHYTEVI